jgi:hypothetical protein
MNNCIHEVNPSGGFAESHTALCALECGDRASRHVRVGGWCGNVCPDCADKLTDDKGHKGIAYTVPELCGIAEPVQVQLWEG